MSEQQNAYDRIIQNYAYGIDTSVGHNYSNMDKSNNGNSDRSFNNPHSSSQNDNTVQRDTIFVENLPKNVTVDELANSFGSIGVIKVDKKTSQPKIWIYKDKTTGEGKGEATITYDDSYAANAAIEWFNEKEILGNIVKIQLATRKSNFSNFRAGGKSNHNKGGFNVRDRHGGGGYERNDRNNDRSRGYSNRNRSGPY